MAHQPDHYSLDGLAGWGKIKAEKFAEKFGENWVLKIKNPRIRSAIQGLDEGTLKMVMEIIDFVSGFFDVPGSGKFWAIVNESLDALFVGAGKGIKRLAEMTPEEARTEVVSTVEKLSGAKAYLVLEVLHKSRECLTVAGYVADTSSPSKKGKDGKEFSGSSRARIVETTVGVGLKAGKPLCPLCFSSGLTRGDIVSENKKSEKSLFEILDDMRGSYECDYEIAEHFMQEYPEVSDGVKAKIRKVCDLPDAFEKIKFLGTQPSEKWEMILDTMVNPDQSVADGFFRIVAKGAEKLISKVGDKLASEDAETDSMMDSGNEKLDQANSWLDRKNAEITAKRESFKKRKQTKTSLKPVAFMLLGGTALAWFVWLIAIG